MVSVTAIVVVMEVGLLLADKLADRTELMTYPLEDGAAYLDEPEEYLKIAIFGGSSAAGYSSERGFADILEYRLETEFPQVKTFIKNYAQPGYPFHLHQAEALKAVIDFYDVFLVYAGHNEALNYLDDVGVFRTAEAKDQPSLQSISVEKSEGLWLSLVRFAKSRSRVYAISRKINEKYVLRQNSGGAGQRAYKYEQFNEIESEKAVPEDVVAGIPLAFGRDLREIARAATAQGKQVIVSSVAVNETYPPFFSVHRSGITAAERAEFQEIMDLGQEDYDAARFDDALIHFMAAAEIDNNISIVNHRIGQTLMKKGDKERAQEYLTRGVDEDGLPLRSLSVLSQTSKSVSNEFHNVHFVDSAGSFTKSMKNGLVDNDLFSDIQHPTFLGHIIIADGILSKMSVLEPLDEFSDDTTIQGFDSINAIVTLMEYMDALAVTPKEQQDIAFLRSRWNLGTADITAYPGRFLDAAEENALLYFQFSSRSDSEKATSLLLRALIEGKRGQAELAVSLGNEALRLAPTHIKEVLHGSGGLPTRDYWLYAFNDLGIQFLDEEALLKLGGTRATEN